MVLPPSTPDPEPDSAQPAWTDRVQRLLELSTDGVLILIDQARPERLGELVRAVMLEHPEVQVTTRPGVLEQAPVGSVVIYQPEAAHASLLNLGRQLLTTRSLRVILFADAETVAVLARQAPDFMDWVSHRIECPPGAPAFAVAGIRAAMQAGAPGIVWRGGPLEATLEEVEPGAHLHWMSAAGNYPGMVEEIRAASDAWLIITEVSDLARLRRIRWALAEGKRSSRVVLMEPEVRSPGWREVHGLSVPLAEAVTTLAKAGAQAGRLAGLMELELEAIGLAKKLLESGQNIIVLERLLLDAEDPGAEIGELAWNQGLVNDDDIIWEKAPSPILRARESFDAELLFRETNLQNQVFNQIVAGRLPDWESIAWIAARVPEGLANIQMNSLTPAVLLTWMVEARLRRPNLLNPYSEWAESANLVGDAEVALYWLREAHEAGFAIESVRALVAEGIRAQAAGEYQRSLDKLQTALSAISGDPWTNSSARGNILTWTIEDLIALGRYHESLWILDQPTLPRRNALANIHLRCKTLIGLARYEEAAGILDQAFDAADELPANYEGNQLLSAHAELNLRLGHYSAAEADYHELERRDPPGLVLSGLPVALARVGKHRRALSCLNETARSQNRQAPDPEQVSFLEARGEVFMRAGRLDEALNDLTQALELRERMIGPEAHLTGVVHLNLGRVLTRMGRHVEALEHLDRAVAILTAAVGLEHDDTAFAILERALALRSSGRSSAMEGMPEALLTLDRLLGPDHPEVAEIRRALSSQ